jgi:hypothetical protein
MSISVDPVMTRLRGLLLRLEATRDEAGREDLLEQVRHELTRVRELRARHRASAGDSAVQDMSPSQNDAASTAQ